MIMASYHNPLWLNFQMATKNTEATKNPPMANEPMMTAADYKFAQQYLDNRMDNTFRWGSRYVILHIKNNRNS